MTRLLNVSFSSIQESLALLTSNVKKSISSALNTITSSEDYVKYNDTSNLFQADLSDSSFQLSLPSAVSVQSIFNECPLDSIDSMSLLSFLDEKELLESFDEELNSSQDNFVIIESDAYLNRPSNSSDLDLKRPQLVYGNIVDSINDEYFCLVPLIELNDNIKSIWRQHDVVSSK